MSCIRKLRSRAILLSCLMSSLLACDDGLQGGSTKSFFSGVDKSIAISPTAIRLSWKKKEGIREYRVYSSTQPEPRVTTALDFTVIEGLAADTLYTFKVEGTDGSKVYGSDREVQVKTWPRFSGVGAVKVNADGTVEINWTYSEKPSAFHVFYQKDAVPTAESTNDWKVPRLVTDQQQAVLKDLDNSSKYHFMVHVLYREGESDITTKSISVNTLTSFATPMYELDPISIGNLPAMRIQPIQDATHSLQFFRSTVLWNGQAISDPLTGAGTVAFLPTAQLPLGKLENLSLQVDYSEGGPTETMLIEGLSTFIKGISPVIEKPSVSGLDLGPGKMGKALAAGDFNCDGADDLAIGLPDVSVASLGMLQPRGGLVVIYYSALNGGTNRYALKTLPAPSLNPAEPGIDPQIITFRDLPLGANFGFSLAAGNLNNDRNGLYACQDLLVGAPGAYNPRRGGNAGNAFLFFGSTKGLSAPSLVSDMPENVATCNGDLAASICSAVRLFEDKSLIPTSLTGGLTSVFTDDNNTADDFSFGYSVAFVGDFNADGYEDVLIGDPSAPFDGDIPNTTEPISNVGAVHFYFGSKYGLGFEYPNASGIPDINSARLRSIKVFPPIPMANARFGAAIGGGADIDGADKVSLSGVGPLVGGADIVIGAPGFSYTNYVANHPLKDYIHPSPTLAGILAHSTGNDGWWKVNGVGLDSPTSFYGFPQDGTAVGAAFVYYGRSSAVANPPPESPSRQVFWQCGNRGLAVAEHFSCLVSNDRVKMLVPRDGGTRGFGSTVALIGSRSRYKDNSTTLLTAADPNPLVPREYFADANGDGYADVIVGAPSTSVSGKSNVGVLWQFFGGNGRLMDAADLFNVYGDGTPVPTKDYRVNDPTCSSFFGTSGATKQACVPVLLRSGSLAENSRLGNQHNQISRGDVTGDGLMDLAVGAVGDTTVQANSGAIIIFTSAASLGLTSNYKKVYTSSADADDALGTSVVLGNFNGDYRVQPPVAPTTAGTLMPYFDLFSGAPNDEINRFGGGAVYGFVSNELALPSVVNMHTDMFVEGMSSNQEYGIGESRLIGDVNGDGYSDAFSKITEVSSTGRVQYSAVIYFGSAIGLITTSFCLENLTRVFGEGGSAAECYPKSPRSTAKTLNDVALPQLIERPANLDSEWAFGAEAAGDVNGDGFGDVLLYSSETAAGRSLVVFFGARGGLQNVIDPAWTPAAGDPQIVTTALSLSNGDNRYNDDAFQLRVPIGVADFNRDGYSDLVIGEGDRSSPYMNTVALPKLPRAEPGYPMGVSAGSGWACGGSTNIDCTSGRPVYRFGIVWVFYGSMRGYQTPRNNGTSTQDIGPGATGTLSGYETEAAATKPCTSSATPNPTCSATYLWNPVFENISFGFGRLDHSFGASIATVDVNRDSYPDLLVGAPGFEDLSCWTGAPNIQNTGRVYVFYGGTNGIVAADRDSYYNHDPLATCPVDPITDPASGLSPGNDKVRTISPVLDPYGMGDNNVGRFFGYSLSSGGDINGDTYEDIVIATPGESTPGTQNSGAIYTYYGPLCPADNDGNVTETFQRQDGSTNNLNRQMYFSGQAPPGTAPTDIFTGTLPAASTAPCFRGASSTMKPLPQKFYVFGSNADEYWGRTLLGGPMKKGDFNKDGFDDILVGSSLADDVARGLTDLGRGAVFFGSSKGLFTADYPTSSLVLNAAEAGYRPFLISPYSYPSNMQFFRGNVSKGDINGDGSMDLMVPSQYYNGTGPLGGILIGTFFVLY